MKIELITDFAIPIWRTVYGTNFDLPWSFEHNGKVYKNYIAIIFVFWCAESNFIYDKNYLLEDEIINTYTENHIICFPTEKAVEMCKKLRPRLNPCLASHNSFIDENLYKIDLNQQIKYDMIVSSAFAPYKNLNLLSNINNVIGTGYGFGSGYTTFHPKNVKIINFTDKNNIEMEKERIEENFRFMEPNETIKLINSSKIGGIFSTVEGSCYSSGEYLLCGTPVLSCKCNGGRETFYDSENSKLCDPNNISVEETLNIMLNKYNNGEYNRENIRNNHIKIMKIQRNNLSKAVLNIMKKIINNVPSLEELTQSLKHFHPNNRMYEYPQSYKRQTEREKFAIEILSK